MTTTFEPSENQLALLLEDYVYTLFRRGAATLDALQCTEHLRAQYGISVDWHLFSSVLDVMERTGRLEVIRLNAGMRVYRRYKRHRE